MLHKTEKARYNAAYRKAHKIEIAACSRAYWKTNKERLTVCHKNYIQTECGKAAMKRGIEKYNATIRGKLCRVFRNMVNRCTNSNRPGYKNYGGRGIKVCFESLDDFRDYVINELQIDPRGLTIDRIDNDGNYEPGNIRFVTAKENCKNRIRRKF